MSSTGLNKTKVFFMTVENNILYCSFDADIIIDEKIINDVIEAKKKLIGNTSTPFIIDFRHVKYFLQGAKELFFSQEGFLTKQPLAIILNSFIIQTAINYLFDTNKIKTPFKICVNEDKAEQWIKKQQTTSHRHRH